jgi:hypothetical protein
VAWNVVDHLVKFEGFNSRVMGTWSLMLMVAKRGITGAEAVPRVPLVAERRIDSVPMGREGGRGIGAEDGEIRWGSGPGCLIPCRKLDWGQLGTPQWEGAPSII